MRGTLLIYHEFLLIILVFFCPLNVVLTNLYENKNFIVNKMSVKMNRSGDLN